MNQSVCLPWDIYEQMKSEGEGREALEQLGDAFGVDIGEGDADLGAALTLRA